MRIIDDLVPVEYVQSSGTQFVDTGLVLDPDTYEYEAKFTVAASSQSSIASFSIAYNSWNSSNLAVILGCGTWNRGYIATSLSAGYGQTDGEYVGWTDGDVMEMKLHGTALTCNGVEYTMTRPSTGTKPSVRQLLFGMNSSGGSGEFPVSRLWYCKIWSSAGVLVRDFVPMRSGSQGFLFDRVSGGAFGDGTLVAGPDLS